MCVTVVSLHNSQPKTKRYVRLSKFVGAIHA